MSDQADKLREIINDLKKQQLTKQLSTENVLEKRKCRVITVTSGKGGVGKTNISVNLALNLSKMGYRVVILDADLGLANIDILFGISPHYTLLDVINNNKTIFDILSDGPMNVKFISGGSGIEEMVHLEKWQLEALIEKVASLDKVADIIIVDTGAGISENVISFVLAADEIILVTTPEPTSIMDAYALVKTVSLKDRDKIIQLVVNRADNEKEAISVMNKLTLAAEAFLGVKLKQLGYVLYDTNVVKAVKRQEPFILSYPKSLVSRQLNEIAHKLMQVDQNSMKRSSGIKGFFRKLANLNNA
ncbi:MAG: flagellar biosynthesis protein FlhG [Petroclostridium sp.]|jgi:flagellar biosynthesis protein FlhG|uniref:MinD/ParA family protein n=1 Tax=Petroclostridium xylanilyticum TaxID=1792311 RepID=UPI000B98E82C|nr:MinD/ParA family protein [Petroclostridium xylanilyticum]MBZ4645880.1 ATPase involved in chromosome partitioning [Clostridia bacterium]MDK2809320.1 flagellar biosynthesis protein FlhG [Petroclostridium sp.]